MTTTGGRHARGPVPGLLVVRTPAGWFVTPAGRTEPVMVDLRAVLAIVRASGGLPLELDERLVDELHDALVFDDTTEDATEDTIEDGSPVAADRGSWSSVTGIAPSPALPMTDWMFPAAALVAKVICGGLLVEGIDGRQLLLDDVDIVLLDALDDPDGSSVSGVIAAARPRLDDGRIGDDDLGGRLARIASIGRIRYYPEPSSAAAATPSPDAPEPSVVPSVSSSTASSARQAVDRVVLRLRTQPFLGRSAVRAAYRRVASARSGPTTSTGSMASSPSAAAASDARQVGDADGPLGAAVAAIDAPPVETSIYLASPRVGPARDGLIPVYAPFQRRLGPILSLAMLTANARRFDEGRLNDVYEIRRTEDSDSFLADLAARPVPAVVLCSNYIWSMAHNLELIERARAINPELLFIHGGPHTPKYDRDCDAFFAEHPHTVDVTVRGEGEVTLVEILRALEPGLPAFDLSLLADVAGISYRDAVTGERVKTPDRDRIADLDSLPSPYLTGELDHLAPQAFRTHITFESNRGCPYGCTFCDWGSMTLSRIRMFDLDRVEAEMAWAGERSIEGWVVADANFGIMARDVEVARRLTAVRRRYGVPSGLGFNVAKNTTKHLTAIVDHLVEEGVAPHVSLALQTRDEDTLEAVRRTNISTDHYVALAAGFRRRGLPLQADLMLGLPGQTVDSFQGDLQFLMDHEVPARVWITQLLPNAPMNDPLYRDEYAVVADSSGVVVSSRSFSPEDRAYMKRLRHAHAVFERFGLLRHLMRYLQWDHRLPVTETMARVVQVTEEDPGAYPLLNWSMRSFDLFGVPPLGWRSFYDEVRRFVVTELGVEPSRALETVLGLQRFLMPEYGRRFPDTIALDHDYVAYYRSATASLWSSGEFHPPERPLADHGPAAFTIYGDPMDRCGGGMRVYEDPRNEAATDSFWYSGHLELDSPLVQNYADIAATGSYIGLYDQMQALAPSADEVARLRPATDADGDGSIDGEIDGDGDGDGDGAPAGGAVPVRLGSRARSATQRAR